MLGEAILHFQRGIPTVFFALLEESRRDQKTALRIDSVAFAPSLRLQTWAVMPVSCSGISVGVIEQWWSSEKRTVSCSVTSVGVIE